jgi:nicotinamidase-related amidase
VTENRYALVVIDMLLDFFERSDSLAARRAPLVAASISSAAHFAPTANR